MKKIFLIVGILLLCGNNPEALAQNPEPMGKSTNDIVGYKNGFYIKSPDGNYTLTLGGYVQALLQGQKNEGAADADTFRVRRARLSLKGNAYRKNIQYNVLYDFAAPALTNAFLRLVHSDQFKFQMGQFKVPFNLEALSSVAALQLVDRSIVNTFFGVPGIWEPGVGIHGMLAGKRFEYSIGTFNGEGINTINANNELRYAGRIVYNALGRFKQKTVSDVKGSESPHLSLVGAGMFNDTLNAAGTAEQKVISLTSEVNFKYRGWGAHGAFFYQHINPDTGVSLKDKAFLIQAGYLLIPEELEIAARVAHIYAESAADQKEYTTGLNYFISQNHRVKLQADYSLLKIENGVAVGNDSINHRGRLQLQVQL